MSYGAIPAPAYSPVAKLLHWLVAIGVLTIIPVGIWMNVEESYLKQLAIWQYLNQLLIWIGLEMPNQNQLFNFHKSLGVLILMLMTLRILYRISKGAPLPEPNIARWQKSVSSAVHGMLYLALLVQPILGYVANSAYGESGTPTPFFGLFELPPIVGPNEALSNQLFTIHRYLGFAIAGLAALHIAGALQHLVIQRDGVIFRMLPVFLGGRKASY